MFSGIIQASAAVRSTQTLKDCKRVQVALPAEWRVSLGQSIAIDGICSTVVDFDRSSFDVEYMPMTLAKTTAELLATGSQVNLERSLTLQSYVDGHLVQGHVDARARVTHVTDTGTSRELTIALSPNLLPFVALHGSVAVNGVSLTVARRARASFSIALIPHTLAHTNLGALTKGSEVNIEVDMVARYLLNGSGRDTVRRHAKKRTRQKA